LSQYETIVIINPELDESETDGVIEDVKATIESSGGKIFKVDLWGRKRLAYTIKRYNNGYYVLVVFESSPELVSQLNSYYQVTEQIIKHIVVRLEEDLTVSAPSDTESAPSDTESAPSDTEEPLKAPRTR
jgi:small subunit ribosomal protein S6